MITKVLKEFINMLEAHTCLKATIGSLPPRNGVAIYIGAGGVTNQFLDSGQESNMYLTINLKHESQEVAINLLDTFNNKIRALTLEVKEEDFFQILRFIESTPPVYVANEKDGFIYSIVLKIKIYYKGV